ncbi:MAG TPA: SurA N-terminal domain-containing protein [Desulfobacteraceae bacterium]|nr:SurA N-terminal domain-containing protein [Desulfobacteraceae bacterium]
MDVLESQTGAIRMRSLKLSIVFIIITIACLLCELSAFAEICNRIVAIVNDDMVTLYELNSKISEITGIDPSELQHRNERMYIETRQKALDLLIDQKLTEKKIRELGIKADKEQVDAAIEKIKRENLMTNEDLIDNLKKQGLTYESLKENIKNDIERMQLINLEVKSKIIIKEEDIKQYYTENKKDFESEEMVHLAAIILKRENPSDQNETDALYNKLIEILLKIRNGEDFGKLAMEFTEGAGNEEGGDLGFFKTAQLDPQLIKILEKMENEDVTDPIIWPSAIQIIKLLDRKKKEVKPIEEVREKIYDILYREEVNKRYSAWIEELRENSFTKIIF